jgi:hypothetical protein
MFSVSIEKKLTSLKSAVLGEHKYKYGRQHNRERAHALEEIADFQENRILETEF